MSRPVDVLAVMDAEIRALPEMASLIRFAGAKIGWGIDESEAVRRMEEARVAVAELIEAATPAAADDDYGMDADEIDRLIKALARVRGEL